MLSSLYVSVLFLFHWDELWLLSPWLWLLILLLLLSLFVPQLLCPPSSTKACLQLCHPAHPPAAVLALGASPSAAAAWLCPVPPAERGAPSLPGTLPWLGAGMLSPLPLLPWPRLILSSCFFHPTPASPAGSFSPFPASSSCPAPLPVPLPCPGPQQLWLFPFSTCCSWPLSPPFPSAAASRSAGAGTW